MNPKQKVIVTQLQIAGAGLLIALFGFLWKEWLLTGFGLAAAVYGLIRMLILSRMVSSKTDPGDENLDLKACLDEDDDDDQDKIDFKEFFR